MTNEEKKIYINAQAAATLRFACCSYRSQLNYFEIFALQWHLNSLKLSYLLRKGWFSWSLFTRNNWSHS